MSKIYKNGIFGKLSPIKRALLFYLICIWVRLFLALIVYKKINNKKILYLVILFSLFAIYLNLSNLKGNVWWNRYIHGLNSILILVCSLLLLNKYIKNDKIIGMLLFWDVIFGILYSFYKKPFNI